MYLTYDRLLLRRRVLATNSGDFVFILSVMVIGECVSGERAVLLLHPQHRPGVSRVSYKPSKAEDKQLSSSKLKSYNLVTQSVCVCVCLHLSSLQV